MFSLGQASYFWSHLNCHPLFHKTLARVLERGALGHRQIVSAINYNAPNQLFSTLRPISGSRCPPIYQHQGHWTSSSSLPSSSHLPSSPTLSLKKNLQCHLECAAAINGGSRAVWKFLKNHLFWRTKASVTMLIRKSYKSEYFLLTCVVMVRQFLTDGIGDESKWIKLSVALDNI